MHHPDRRLHPVNAHVRLQISLRRKCAAAYFTFIRPFAGGEFYSASEVRFYSSGRGDI